MTLVNFGDWAAQWDELEEAWSVSSITADDNDQDNRGDRVDNES